MQVERLTYPPADAPLLDAYDRRFESAYVILHPFVSLPDDLAWKVTGQYPSDEQILRHGAKYSWAGVAAQTGLQTCAKLNQALLTSTRSIDLELCDYAACDALQRFLKSRPIWMPGEGRFEPLLQMDFLDAFESAGCEELVFVPESPEVDPVERLPVSRFKNSRPGKSEAPFPWRGTLLAPDASFLLTVAWDSFFTLFYGPRAFLAEFVSRRALEGFFATPTTDHAWFNYSMGCSAVTLSPESWTAS